MKTVYINERGVRPWESLYPTNDSKFSTTTFLSHNFNCAWESWCNVMEQLSETWPFKREWRSTLTADFNSTSEEYLFKKHIARTLHEGDLCKKNDQSGIYSTIRNLPSDPKHIQDQTFEGSHNTLLVAQKSEEEIEEFWLRMTIFEKCITPLKISKFLDSQKDTLICRFYDAETHATAQIFHNTSMETDTIIKAAQSQFNKINVEDVSNYINKIQKT
ncbi:hypothetical protein [Pseudomonas sp.]|uniref:hypothetical protein n=1 Tax=Pseudomonas sp. TaxID=306 RepID=UPI003C679445